MIKKLPDQNYVVLKFLVEFISLVVDRYVLSLTFFSKLDLFINPNQSSPPSTITPPPPTSKDRYNETNSVAKRLECPVCAETVRRPMRLHQCGQVGTKY